jgi:Right handed beta helix region
MEQRDSFRTPARSAWYRRRSVIVACAVTLVASVGIAGVYFTGSGSDPREPHGGSPVAAPESPGSAPSAPPVRICNNSSVLDGPSRPPAGAVAVRTSQNLNDLTQQNPPGTTFWLPPGIHKLGTGPFSQVIPKDGNTYLGAPGAILDGQRLNRYAFTGYATRVTVKYLTVQNFGPRGTNSDEGVVNHDAATGWIIERNTVWNNAGAGVMVGSRNLIRNNCLMQNGQYGFNAYNPDNVTGITIEQNEIAGNSTDDWETARPGCGCTGGGKFWKVTGAVVRNNWVHHNKSAGLWADTNNVGFAIEGNYIADNDAEGVLYEASYNAVIRRNTFMRNGHVKGPANRGFPTGAVYLSESGSDDRVSSDHNETFEISHNVFTDNWAGVILWENADRFAGSPANTSTDASTLVNPGVVTARTCNAANIRSRPYIDDCRWKTQNVHVHHNLFTLDPGEIGTACASRSGCGSNGLFSNWGTFPAWSPYKANVVQEMITSKQGNRFFGNTYAGPWHFVVHGQGTIVNWATWQGAPYGQDGDSVIKVTTAGER